MKRSAAFLILAACAGAADPAAEFSELLESRIRTSGRIEFDCVLPSAEDERLVGLAWTSPALFDRLLLELSRHGRECNGLPDLTERAPFSICRLGEAYSQGLVDRLAAERDASRQRFLLEAIVHHCRHGHAAEAARSTYDSSVAGRLRKILPEARSGYEAWLATRVQCAYLPWFREAREEVWARIGGEAEGGSRGDFLKPMLDLASADRGDLRREIHSRLVAILTGACGRKSAWMERGLLRDPLEAYLRRLPAQERCRFESALSVAASGAEDPQYRLEAVFALAALRSPTAGPLLSEWLDRSPGRDGVGAVVGRIQDVLYKDQLCPLMSRVCSSRVRLACVLQYGALLEASAADDGMEGLRELEEWLMSDPEADVREAALRKLASRVRYLVLRGRLGAAELYELGNELFDIVLADPSVDVRRAGVRAIKPYERYIDFLDAPMRAKVERLVQSIGP